MAQRTFDVFVNVNTRDADRSLSRLNRSLDSTQRNLQRTGKNASGATGGLSRATKAVAGLAAAVGVAGLAKSIFEVNSRFEDLQTTLNVVTGSVEEGSAAFQRIQALAVSTPFGVDQLTESFIKLKSSGIEPTNELLTLFSDVASVTTDRVGSLQAITDLYARTTSGGLGLEELNRLADRGIPVFNILSDRLGVTRLEVSKLGQSAEGAQLILGELEAGLKDAFGGASAQAADTLSVRVGNLNIAFQNLALAFGSGGVSDTLKNAISGVTDIVVNLTDEAALLGGAFNIALARIASAFRRVGIFAGAVVESINGALENFPLFLDRVGQGLANWARGIIEQIAAFGRAVSAAFREAITGNFSGARQAFVEELGKIDYNSVVGGPLTEVLRQTAPAFTDALADEESRLANELEKITSAAGTASARALNAQAEALKANTEAKRQNNEESAKTPINLQNQASAQEILTASTTKLTEAQKEQQKLAKQIEGSYESLGEAVGRWAQGTEDAIRGVVAELLRLASLQIFGNNPFLQGFLSGFGQIRGFASGGQFRAGETFVVGEAGPEIITSSAPGTVIPNGAAFGSARSGSVTIAPQLTINGGVNGVDELQMMFQEFSLSIAEQTEGMLRQQLRTGGVLR